MSFSRGLAIFIAIAIIIAVALEALFGIFGLFTKPQYLDFKYKVVQIPPGARAQISADLASGARSFTDANLGGSATCDYIATEDAVERDLHADLNNSETVVSIRIEAELEQARLTPGCQSGSTFVADLFDITASNLSISGAATTIGTGSVRLKSPTDGTKLFEVDSAVLRFNFVLDSYNAQYGQGAFEFLATRPNSNDVLMVYDGHFGLDK
jgi:hypothetical protein